MVQTVETVWRDYSTAGVPASGAHQPVKREIRELLSPMEAAINSFLANGGFIFTDLNALFADLNHVANSMAWVILDSTVANNGIYQKQGASGTGSWLRVADLPYNFVKARDDGDGTANAILATSTLPIHNDVLVACNVFRANTASPVTVRFNGGGVLTVKSPNGNDIAPGGLLADMVMLGYQQTTIFRLLSDPASAANAAAAEAAQAAAEDARDMAIAAADQAAVEGAGDVPMMPSRAFAIAATIPTERTYVQLAGYASAGDGGQALYKKVGTEPTHAGKFQSVDGAWWEICEAIFDVKMFGATGNGITNDTTAIQTAINTAGPTNRTVYFPPGVYIAVGLVITPTQNPANGYVINNPPLLGAGPKSSIIHRPTDTNGHLLTVNFIDSNPTTGSGYRAAHTHITGIKFIGHGGTATTGHSLYCPSGNATPPNVGNGFTAHLLDVDFDGSPQSAIWSGEFRNSGYFLRVIAQFTKDAVIYFNGGDHSFVECSIGAPITATVDAAVFEFVFSSKFFGCDFFGSNVSSQGSGVAIIGGLSYLGFHECVFNGCGQHGVRLFGSGGGDDYPVQFHGCMFSDNSQQTNGGYNNILISDRTNVAVQGCKFLVSGAANKPAYHVGISGSGVVSFNNNAIQTGSSTVGVCNTISALRSAGSTTHYIGAVNDATGLPAYGASGAVSAWFESAGAFRVNASLFVGPSGVVNRWQSDGVLVVSNAGYKPGGGAWLDASDVRMKIVLGDYAYGLDAIKQITPKRYTFRGNDTNEPPETGKTSPYENSGHRGAAVSGKEFVGVIAQEIESVMPGMVTQTTGYIDGVEVSDKRVVDTSELVFALVNAVKELTTRLEAVESAP